MARVAAEQRRDCRTDKRAKIARQHMPMAAGAA
jgi:hypothetical protein